MIGAHPRPSNNSLAHLHRSRHGRTHYSSTITVGTTQVHETARARYVHVPFLLLLLHLLPSYGTVFVPIIVTGAMLLLFDSHAQEREEKKKR